jgi:hypothetical protein
VAPLPGPAASGDAELLASEREMLAHGRAEAAEARAAELERELIEHASKVTRALAAIEDLRDQLEAVRAERAREVLTAAPAAPVDPERLAAALLRLRADAPGPEDPLDAPAAEASSAPEQAPEQTSVPERAPAREMQADTPSPAPPLSGRATKPWLGRVFRKLTDQDAPAAGLLALALLPALRLVESEPFGFDLILAELGSIQVTVAPGGVQIAHAVTPRGRDETSFRLVGDVQSFARLLAAGPIRRRIGRRLATVEGDRGALRPLLALTRTPLDVRALREAGTELDPWQALNVVALMLRPRWTKGERFIVAHQEPGQAAPGTYLHIRDGRPPHVSHREPLGPVAATIVCLGGSLLVALDGDDRVELEVRGEHRPFELLRDWVKRAQSE